MNIRKNSIYIYIINGYPSRFKKDNGHICFTSRGDNAADGFMHMLYLRECQGILQI